MKINDLPPNRASFRITLIIGLVMILCILAEGVLSLIVYRNDTIETQATRAKTIAVSVASAIRDPDRLKEAYASGSENEYWKEMKSYLDEVKMLTGAAYLYILDARLDDNVYYIMEGALPGEEVPGIGDTDSAEEFAVHEFTETLRSGGVTTGVYNSAEYGVYVFSYAAITGTDGKPAAIVGADIHIGYVTAASTRFVARTAVFSLIFCVLLSLFVRWYIRRNVGSPLERAAQLKEAHDRVKVFLDAMPFPCRLWNRDYKVFDCNDEAVRFYGLGSKEEMIDRFSELYPEYQPDGQLTSEKIAWTLEKAFAEGMYTYEAMHLTPDGVLIPVESILVRVKYGDDYVLACYTRDLSEYKKMMEEIDRSTRLLKTAAAELEAALNSANDANQAKSDFLAHMSHEMRTPLNAIIGLSDLVLGTEDLNEESSSNLEKINNAGMTLLGTVNDILDIAKIEAGKFELTPVEYDTPSLINDTVSQNILRIGEKPVEFVLNISGDFPANLYGDEIRVKQMLSNLLSNAFKYTQQGTVELSIHSARKQNDVWLTASIRDTGIGIKPEDMEKLFGAYNQVDTVINRDIEGTGLGLQITRRMVEIMQGTVSVESEYGKGSTFTVNFRQQFVSEATIGPETAGALMRFHYTDYKRRSNMRFNRISMPYARVLVVDDVQTNLDVARGLLKPYKMQVDCVTSGQEAIDAIRGETPRFDAVFMDHMMPEMNGVEATHAIRGIGTDYAANVPIIALTANAIVGNEDMFLHEGFQAFIPKPIDIMKLDEVLRNWVRSGEHEKQYEKLLAERKNHDIRSTPDRRSGIDRRALGLGIDGLNISKGIERFGSESAYIDIVRSFASNTPALLEKLEQVTREDIEDYVIVVHGIKGSARGICADAFADIAEALESAARSGDFSYITAHNGHFLDAGWKLLSDIGEMLPHITADMPEPAGSRDSVGAAARRRIILVDDNLTNLEMGRKMLSEYYQVIPAVSAAQMFEILETVMPDLILLDIEMPVMNGYEAIKLLKANPLYTAIYVMFLTGKSDEVNEQEGLSLGAADYVYKPYAAMLLHNRIEHLLGAVRGGISD